VQITAGDTALWQRHNNGSIWRYIGPGIKWSLVQEGVTGPIAAGARGDRLYQHAGNNILEYTWMGPAMYIRDNRDLCSGDPSASNPSEWKCLAIFRHADHGMGDAGQSPRHDNGSGEWGWGYFSVAFGWTDMAAGGLNRIESLSPIHLLKTSREPLLALSPSRAKKFYRLSPSSLLSYAFFLLSSPG
jgi:hypothetical protein